MSELNRTASEVLIKYNVHACTDVTGFGLLGHMKEMSVASGCNVSVDYNKIPWIREVKNFATAGVIPGGTYNNLSFVESMVDFGNLPKTDRLLLCDAQTSGGLLISLPDSEAGKLIEELQSKGLKKSSVIASITGPGEGRIKVIR
jgi:selenide,water dikinase